MEYGNQHSPQKWTSFVGKYTSTMEYNGYTWSIWVSLSLVTIVIYKQSTMFTYSTHVIKNLLGEWIRSGWNKYDFTWNVGPWNGRIHRKNHLWWDRWLRSLCHLPSGSVMLTNAWRSMELHGSLLSIHGIATDFFHRANRLAVKNLDLYWLVVEPPLWKILVSWDDYSEYMGKWKMFQPTNQYKWS